MTKVAIIQSNYIPWKGYFDIINLVDKFILLDDVQYTRRDWRNRNKIKTFHGIRWLTIPVKTKGNYYSKIRDIEVLDDDWAMSHWLSILHSYSQAKFFDKYKEFFFELYLRQKSEKYLSIINYNFIQAICKMLGIKTEIIWSHEFIVPEGKTERLVSICQQVGATEYISGPSAKQYIQADLFMQAGIQLKYIDYSGYPEYNQLFPPFSHEVSIIDLIFNEGENTYKYMKSFQGSKMCVYQL